MKYISTVMEVKKIMEMNQQSVHDYANVINQLDGSTTNKLLHEVGVFNENSCIIKYSEKAITNLLNEAKANSTDLTVSIEGGKMDYLHIERVNNRYVSGIKVKGLPEKSQNNDWSDTFSWAKILSRLTAEQRAIIEKYR